jgi:hypothetical protein
MRTEPLTIIRGDTYLNTLPIAEPDGSAYDLTGASVWLTVKPKGSRTDDDDDALIQLTVGDGITVADPASGEIAVKLTDEQTGELAADTTYRYDLQIRKGGDTFTPIGGPLVVLRDTTRA